MYSNDFKFFDCHVHFNKDTNIPDSIKAFEKHLIKGGKVGCGYGVLILDGEKIINI